MPIWKIRVRPEPREKRIYPVSIPHSLHLLHNILWGLHRDQLTVVFQVHQPSILVSKLNTHNICNKDLMKKKNIMVTEIATQDWVCLRKGRANLARSIALRSFFAQSAIRERERATLQLRNIWKTERHKIEKRYKEKESTVTIM